MKKQEYSPPEMFPSPGGVYFFSFYLFLFYCLYMALVFDGGRRETKNNIFYGCCGLDLSCGGGGRQFRQQWSADIRDLPQVHGGVCAAA